MNEETLASYRGKLSIELPLEQAQAIRNNPNMIELNNRLHMINKIYNRYCEEFEIAQCGTGDPQPFPQAVLNTCLQNGLLRYEDGRLTAMPQKSIV